MDAIDDSAVTDSLLEPVFAVTTDDDIAFVNERFLEITQLSRRDVLENDITSIEEFVASGFDTLRDAIGSVSGGRIDERRVTVSMQHPPSAPVSQRLTAQARVAPIVSDGVRVGAVVALRDVSKQKKRQRELRRQNERLDEFVSVVSHDLRNPLNVATARLDLAGDECDSPHLEDVATALDRMDTLIEDLLTVARQGKQIQETETVSLLQIGEECFATIPADGATLDVETERSVGADPSRVKQLVENLMRNAVEHGGEEVTIRIGDLPGGFYVADDGPGIDENEREMVFDAGYSTTREGTGFGLNIVREIAEAHGWEVDVTDSEDGGARFEITGVEATP